MAQFSLFQTEKPFSSLTKETSKKRSKRNYDEQQRSFVLQKLNQDAQVLGKKFKLNVEQLLPERRNVRNRYGICYSDGVIKIRLNDLRTGKMLRYSSLIDTVCHELAHLRYMNHGIRFQKLYRRILEFARKIEIYQPHQPLKQKELIF